MDRTEVGALVIALIKSELNGTAVGVEVKEKLTPEVLPYVYALSKAHDLAHVVGDALFKNGVEVPAEIKAKFLKQQNLAVFRYERIKFELEDICAFFDEKGIPYMPLKGSVIRKYYPRPEMRTSCDIDILVKKKDVDKAVSLLVKEKGYTKEKEEPHDISLFSASGVHIELHFRLKDEDDGLSSLADEFFSKIWSMSELDKKCRYKMQDEVFMTYVIFHMAKHFVLGGCGLRFFLDLWILKNYMPYDRDKLESLLKECELSEFASVAIDVSEMWFGEKESNEFLSSFQKYIFNGGLYGGRANQIIIGSTKYKSKWKYFLSRVFLPYDKLCLSYPSLEKYPVLYPFCQICRWFRIIFRKKGYTAKQEIDKLKGIKESDQKEIIELYDKLGFKFRVL